MGLWDKISSNEGKSDSGRTTTKTSVDKENSEKVRVDRYTHSDGGKHEHDSYIHDKGVGGYREYRGGKNSSDRSYNKNKS